MAQYQMVMESGPTPGKIFDLSNPDLYIGRDISNDIVINDAEVSRKHLHVTQQGSSFVIEDLGSTNGTIVNGQRITGQYVLNSGDTVMLGANVVMTFSAAAYDPNVTAIASSPIEESPAAPPPAAAVPEPAPPPVVAESQPYTTPPVSEPVYDYDDPEPTPIAQPQAPGAGTFVESTPFEADLPAEEKKSRRPLIIGGCGCLAITVLCIVPALGAWYIDANNLWCDIAPFIANCAP